MWKPEALWAVFPFFSVFSFLVKLKTRSIKSSLPPARALLFHFLAAACISLRWVTVFVLRLPRRSRRSDGETEPDDENEEKSDYFSRRIFYYRVIEAQIGCQRVSLGDTAKKKYKKQRNKWKQGCADDSK